MLRQLAQKNDDRHKVISTWTGTIAQVDKIVAWPEKYGLPLVMSDGNVNSTGVMGKTGRGVHEHLRSDGEVGYHYLGTLGKPLVGASGGIYFRKKRDYSLCLRQRSRPYLFSNTLASFPLQVLFNSCLIYSRDYWRLRGPSWSQNTTYLEKK